MNSFASNATVCMRVAPRPTPAFIQGLLGIDHPSFMVFQTGCTFSPTTSLARVNLPFSHHIRSRIVPSFLPAINRAARKSPLGPIHPPHFHHCHSYLPPFFSRFRRGVAASRRRGSGLTLPPTPSILYSYCDIYAQVHKSQWHNATGARHHKVTTHLSMR